MVAALIILLFLFFVFVLGFIPRSTLVAGAELRIASLFHTWTYPLADIRHIEPARLRLLKTLRLGALGRPFPPNGWVWDSRYGRFRALASSRRDLYMLTLSNGSHLLVSLTDPATRAALGAAHVPSMGTGHPPSGYAGERSSTA